MKIDLLSLTLINFKGIREQTISFSHVTNIFGDNGTCKTSVFDGFTWLLFGKDSHDRKDFNIKPLDKKGRTIDKLENEVSGKLSIDGREVVLRRVHREVWEKPRGKAVAEFKGNETVYFYNEIPLKAGDYQEKINDILKEGVFKLITNTLYFNSLPWEKQRSCLKDIAGDISTGMILDRIATIQNKTEMGALINALDQGTSIREYKATISGQKKKIKDELQLIPARIDEVNRGLPEALNYDEIQSEIDRKNLLLNKAEKSLLDKSNALSAENETRSKKQTAINNMTASIQQIDFDIKQKVSQKRMVRLQEIGDVKQNISSLTYELDRDKRDYDAKKKDKETYERQLETLRTEWHAINAREPNFDEVQTSCPSCKQAIPEDQIETSQRTIRENFNKEKQRKLSNNMDKGKTLRTQIQDLQEAIDKINPAKDPRIEEKAIAEEKLTTLTREHEAASNNEAADIDAAIKLNEERNDLKQKIATIKEELDQYQPEDTSDVLSAKRAITAELDQLKKQLNTKDARESATKRVLELQQQEEHLSQKLAILEATDFLIEQYTKAEIDILESRINGKFKIVSFKMFNVQNNGGMAETCECTVDGVPFSDLNTASKINAGIDIINALCDHYQVHAPIFIDNRESVNSLIASKSQLVNLIVSKDKKLKVTADAKNGVQPKLELQD